jgi:hypothetical protein
MSFDHLLIASLTVVASLVALVLWVTRNDHKGGE